MGPIDQSLNDVATALLQSSLSIEEMKVFIILRKFWFGLIVVNQVLFSGRFVL